MVKGDETLVVYADDGQYGDTDLLLCATKDAPDVPTVMLAAQFIAYGPIVYQYNTPEEVGKAVYAIDPAATLDAVVLYKEEETRRRARNTGVLEPENPTPAPDAVEQAPTDTPPEPILPQEPAPTADQVPQEPTPTPETTPDVPTDDVPAAESVLPSGGIDTSVSTTTEEVITAPSSSETDITSEVFIQ